MAGTTNIPILDRLRDAPYGAYAIDLDQTIVFWNAQAEDILGHEAARDYAPVRGWETTRIGGQGSMMLVEVSKADRPSHHQALLVATQSRTQGSNVLERHRHVESDGSHV